MADINIQRKKTAPSPWILVLLAAAVLAIAAYFFLRQEPADEPIPANTTGIEATSADSISVDSLRAATPLGDPATGAADSVGLTQDATDYSPATLAAQAATDPSAPNYALNGLQKLAGILVALTDRTEFRDPAVMEQRDNLTSATNRLGEANASLRPGFVAAAGLIRTMQQKAYPELEGAANDLVRLAAELSGRSATAAEQQQNKQFLTQAAAAVRVLSEPAQ
ncbi:hypothetical protein I2I05_03225 [Hymenobacter sp. BT683]|uniref:Uncharacterized protein n=1 Tax=Hymenobacter jeongseonensis TaxID=2791027 RepID=A0ABS0IDJ0_9BACT|nr:hypothetical protein [Hymenobacter jeongseonensis]MBF9236398.1 hypothetical protein [Hymenobacter jeongseonensis]